MKTTYYTNSRYPRQVVLDQTIGRAPHLIGIVVFDGFSMLPAAEVVDVFDKANQILTVRRRDAFYKTVFISLEGSRVSSSAQIDVLTNSLEYLGKARAIFIASGERSGNAVQDSHFRKWLINATDNAKDVFSIGHGDALLSAVRAGTSQEHVTRSGVRQALEMIKQDFGVSVLRRVQELLPGTRLPEFEAIADDSGKSVKEKIHESAAWIKRNCNKSISITVAAQTAGMSDRSYLRHFRAEMGVKPSEHLRRSRVELAAALLESSDLPVDKIARRCGLTSGECLARLFRQVWQISPTEYRSKLRLTNIKA